GVDVLRERVGDAAVGAVVVDLHLDVGAVGQRARPAAEDVAAVGADVVGAGLPDRAVIRIALQRDLAAGAQVPVGAETHLSHVPRVVGGGVVWPDGIVPLEIFRVHAEVPVGRELAAVAGDDRATEFAAG